MWKRNEHNQRPVLQREEFPSAPLSDNLADNRIWVEETYADCQDLKLIAWSYGPQLDQTAFSVYLETLVKDEKVTGIEQSLQELVTAGTSLLTETSLEDVQFILTHHAALVHSAIVLEDGGQVLQHILDGRLVVFLNNWNKAVSYDAQGVSHREVSEPITESVVQGPHNSTIENLTTNIGLIRSLLKSPKLKFEFKTAGEISRRTIGYGYLEGAVNPESLSEFKRRIADIDTEEIMETSYLEEWIGESRYSPFPQVRYTERPDNAAAALLDGKIIALVNGTPTILICPVHFFEFLTTSEDYYHRFIFSSLIRLLRVWALVMALMLPSTYIALSTFHSELLPTVLLLAILDTREGIPFPAFVEALIMEFFFELLREAGIRLPRPIGSAVSIVGALVIGEAAIQAKIASPVMVIIVALTGIASFSLPQYSLAVALRILRFPLMALAATFGGLGIMIGFLLVLLHLTSLRSLGQPYLAPVAPLDIKQWRDIFIMIPRKFLLHSPRNRHLHKKPGGRGK
ncbi:spore germination protein [Paenibacillus hodogayensis]|uniref:Spore germination protein n=1 Tax=Paenibacillus hodogayensis TaxID=279208 RepID=A0ABV5W3V0_9BACL